MKRKTEVLLALLATLVLVFAVGCPSNSGNTVYDIGGHEFTADPSGGLGYVEENDGSWSIYTAAGLQAWAKAVNGDGTEGDLTISATMYNCIDMSGVEWTPVGNYNYQYIGTFDGGGHTVSNLVCGVTIDSDNDAQAGFFGATGSSGTVKNLGVSIASFTTDYSSRNVNVGGIVGSNRGTIIACWSAGNITATGGSIRNCAGGIAGYTDSGTITACYSTADIMATGGSYARGIVGYRNSSTGTVTACYWSSDSVTQGVGNISSNTETFKVDTTNSDSDWIAAETAMNNAIEALERSGTSVGCVYDGATSTTPPMLKKSS